MDPQPKEIIIIAFYTMGTPYKKQAIAFVENMKKFELLHHVYPIASKGKWELNCGQKPRVLLTALDEFKDFDLLYLDIDARIIRKPTLNVLKGLHTPGFCFWKNSPFKKNELLSGTIFLPNNKVSRDLLNNWINIQTKYPYKWDQRNLQNIVGKFPHFVLSLRWCYIDKHMKGKVDKPFILQTQVSKSLKNKVKKKL